MSRPRLALLGWTVVVGACATALRRAGAGELAPPPVLDPRGWGEWVAGRDPVVAAVALLRLLALAAVWYLLVAAAVGLVLRALRAERLVGLADLFTVAPLRRMLVGVAGISLASGVNPSMLLTPPAAAQVTVSTSPPSTVVPGGTPGPTITMRLLPGPEAGPVPSPAPAGPVVAAPSGTAAQERTWTVRPGDCFWSIADEVLAQAWGTPPSDAEIIPYWRDLIEVNRHLLADRSNADLIFPGQVFTLPPVPAP